jgi:hypothetical protein
MKLVRVPEGEIKEAAEGKLPYSVYSTPSAFNQLGNNPKSKRKETTLIDCFIVIPDRVMDINRKHQYCTLNVRLSLGLIPLLS